MGGEKQVGRAVGSSHQGSPPHGRGKEIEPSTIARTVGITPAWAGKRSPASNSRPLLKDHPRMGGEKVPVAEQASNGKGSPPHGRGKDSAGYFWLEGSRITPAWAGKSPSPECGRLHPGDHPRMGGEKLKIGPISWRRWGSPPHGRGKGVDDSIGNSSVRITPAWAGKSRRARCWDSAQWDHPRMGGEKVWRSFWFAPARGSPPRGRGKAILVVQSSRCLRITPAWAGKSRNRKLRRRMRQDHPRVGGEKHRTGSRREYLPGITPAWAGKSYTKTSFNAQKKDHPRVGGEKTKKIP